MATNSFTLTSDASVALNQLTFASNAQIGTLPLVTTYNLPFTSDATIVAPAPPGPGFIGLPPNACDIASPCVDPSSPVANFSAEQPDQYLYIGYSFDPFIPNLGNEFVSTGCIGTCIAGTQVDADMCAQSQQVFCQTSDPNTGNVGGGGYRQPGGNPVNIFVNNPVSCTGAKCPDGLSFTYTVPFGRVAGYSQIQADSIAFKFACAQARTHIVCLSNLEPGSPCVGSNYVGVITASGNTVDNFFSSNLWQVVSGSMPPGLSFPSGFGGPSIMITGTPTQSGVFPFSVRITTPSGDYMQKSFSFCVIGMTFMGSTDPDNQNLPDGSQGQSYNVTLTTASCATPPVNWQVTSGQLPPGLSLDQTTGIISGTPTQSGKFAFTITLQTQAT